MFQSLINRANVNQFMFVLQYVTMAVIKESTMPITSSLQLLAVFIEGVLSFFSPCVLPLIPLYMGYLTQSGKQVSKIGEITYKQKSVFLYTYFFVLGISSTFFFLGFSLNAFKAFFLQNARIINLVGGIIIIGLGLFQCGLIRLPFLQKQFSIKSGLNLKKMNLFIAFLLGFLFSFAWTPCVGPALSSVLILSSTQSATQAVFYIGIYTIGFIIPFLALGLFTSQLLNFIKKKQSWLLNAVKLGGVLLIGMGLFMAVGYFKPAPEVKQPIETETPSIIKSFDFEYKDQFDQPQSLSQYKGKVVFLQFWGTWCGYCKQELPFINELYLNYGENSKDVVFLGVIAPDSKEKSWKDIKKFMSDNQYVFPTVYDSDSSVFSSYGISAFPTVYMIDRNGNILGYVSGAIDSDTMIEIINQAMEIPLLD